MGELPYLPLPQYTKSRISQTVVDGLIRKCGICHMVGEVFLVVQPLKNILRDPHARRAGLGQAAGDTGAVAAAE